MYIIYNNIEVLIMCYVTSTELKNNLSYYLELSEKENVFVTKNKRVISVISNPIDKGLENFLAMRGTFGKVSDDTDYDEIVKEEILKRCGY